MKGTKDASKHKKVGSLVQDEQMLRICGKETPWNALSDSAEK